jgi:hypothetical protein
MIRIANWLGVAARQPKQILERHGGSTAPRARQLGTGTWPRPRELSVFARRVNPFTPPPGRRFTETAAVVIT